MGAKLPVLYESRISLKTAYNKNVALRCSDVAKLLSVIGHENTDAVLSERRRLDKCGSYHPIGQTNLVGLYSILHTSPYKTIKKAQLEAVDNVVKVVDPQRAGLIHRKIRRYLIQCSSHFVDLKTSFYLIVRQSDNGGTLQYYLIHVGIVVEDATN